MQYFGGTTNTIFCKLEKFVRWTKQQCTDFEGLRFNHGGS
jgi:hypothetical protein